ncbi:bacterial Ig-like domain-containing protein [uncultured Treponema sp.]|uniref:bacterial Ig-like domain-containing protein n=1 Tax=uncultured Treponema sp. TaxID=162155 RepID=UPI0025984EA4|nr:bacterial Ig-like domain-containing protein [uncultured Treponema sp.]
MKKTRFILGVIAAIAAAAMTGCQLELNNTEDRVSVGGYAVKSIEISGGTKSFVIDTAFTKGDLKVVAHSYDPAEAEAGVEVTDYTVSIPEGTKFNAVGTKEVDVTYKGFTAKYSIEITNAVKSIAVNSSAAKTKFYTYKGVGSDFTSDGIKVTATYSDKTTREISEYTVDSSAFKSTQAGTYTITVKYSDTITATYDVEVAEATDIKEATLVTKNAGWTGSATSAAWWTDMGGASDAKVEAGSVVSSKFTVNSATTINWCQLPCVVLRSEDGDGAGTEYAVVRGDNYGWKGEVKTSEALATLGWELSSDWNWEEFCSWTNGATCTVSVINWGNGTAEVRYDLEKDGTTHFQYYKNIKVDADVFFRLKGDAGTSITFAE